MCAPQSGRTDIAAAHQLPERVRPAADTKAFTIDGSEVLSVTEEFERLESLKCALFGALTSSPSAALPLVDLATTYSNLLKLQLTLLPQVRAPSARVDTRARREPELLKR